MNPNASARELVLSVVIPAYNETARLPNFLTQAVEYLETHYARQYEVIVVDDGSTDDTQNAVTSMGFRHVRVIRHQDNRGKGSAVRTGVLATRGQRVLFADADGATPILEEKKLAIALASGIDVALGSRACHDGPAVDRGQGRRLAATTFGLLTRIITGLSIRDTQCGFKMFQGDVARELFRVCDRHDFLFDVYIIKLAQKIGYTIVEIGVQWNEIPGSKVRIIRDSFAMAAGLLWVRRKTKKNLASRHLNLQDATVLPANRGVGKSRLSAKRDGLRTLAQ